MLLGWLATVAFLVRLLPQPLRLLRTGVPTGVSPMALMNIAMTELAWLGYGLAEGLPPVWLVSLPAFPLGMWAVILVRRSITRTDLLGSATWLAVIVGSAVAGVLAVALACSVLVNYGPQVYTAVRGHDLQGLAPATWYLALADAALWGAYGYAVHDPALLGYSAVLTLSAAIILTRIARTRTRTPRRPDGAGLALTGAADST